ncbi:MAG: hypothetical protein WC773_02645 [Patescibacteria group bacterium]|jgi:hypothetical protein
MFVAAFALMAVLSQPVKHQIVVTRESETVRTFTVNDVVFLPRVRKGDSVWSDRRWTQLQVDVHVPDSVRTTESDVHSLTVYATDGKHWQELETQIVKAIKRFAWPGQKVEVIITHRTATNKLAHHPPGARARGFV